MFDPSSQRSKETALISAPAPNASTSPTIRFGQGRASPRSAPTTSDDAASAPHNTADPMRGLHHRLQRKRRPLQGPPRQLQQRVRVVVARDAVEPHGRARVAAVHERPLAVLADGDGDGLHRAGARGRPVSGHLVEVPAPEAARAVIAVPGARRRSGYVQPTVAAAEAVPPPSALIARQGRPPMTERAESSESR